MVKLLTFLVDGIFTPVFKILVRTLSKVISIVKGVYPANSMWTHQGREGFPESQKHIDQT